MHSLDRLHFYASKIRSFGKNKRFHHKYGDISLPPAYMLYESYRLDYEAYYIDGMNSASWLSNELKTYVRASGSRILEWGCGPARIIRHLPALMPQIEFHGTDYNASTIQWCQQNITGIHFSQNLLIPPLKFAEHFFDAAYALSVFTHLSESNQIEWLAELWRVVRPGGILLLTTQGSAFVSRLTPGERKQFTKGVPVIRGSGREGHRVYSAFQPELYMQTFFQDQWMVLKFIKGALQKWGPEQDIWIVQKIDKHHVED